MVITIVNLIIKALSVLLSKEGLSKTCILTSENRIHVNLNLNLIHKSMGIDIRAEIL